MDRRVADDAVIRPAAAGLELGLDEGDDRGLRARAGACSAIGPSTSATEMNETSTTARSIGSGSVVGGQRPGVRPLHRHDPLVAPERLGELAAPDVDRVDARRAALEQHVGEAAGRRAHVEADQPGGSIPNASSAAASLWPPPAPTTLIGGHRRRRRRGPIRAVAGPDLAGEDQCLRLGAFARPARRASAGGGRPGRRLTRLSGQPLHRTQRPVASSIASRPRPPHGSDEQD